MLPSDEILLLEVRNGKTESFQELFSRHQQAVFRFFARRVLHRARSEDLTQDTFLALFRGAARYEPRDSFRSYLFGIAYRILLADRRKQPDDAPLPDLEREGSDGGAIDQEIWVRQALGQLEPDDRQILMLREYEQLSYEEIGKILALPLNTVRSRLFRSRMALKKILEDGRVLQTAKGDDSCR